MYPAFVSTTSSCLRRSPHEYFAAHSDVSGRPFSSISRRPVSKMKEKSFVGSDAAGAEGERPPDAAGVERVFVPLAMPAKLPRPGLPPRRPPDRLRKPSTLSLK